MEVIAHEEEDERGGSGTIPDSGLPWLLKFSGPPIFLVPSGLAHYKRIVGPEGWCLWPALRLGCRLSQLFDTFPPQPYLYDLYDKYG